MNVFEKISRFFLGTTPAPPPSASPAAEPKADTTPELQTVAKSDDVYQRNNHDIARIVQRISGLFSPNANLGDKELLLLTDDALELYRLRSNDFLDALRYQLASQTGEAFRRITVTLRADSEGTPIGEDLYLAIGHVAVQTAKAQIKVMEDYGSLAEAEYILAVEGTYHIGVGADCVLQNGSLRHNHIVINPDEDDAQYVKNRYVSRAHAKIVCSHTDGFLLYVEQGGLRLSGHRTRILRHEQVIDLNNPMVPQQLQDGDIIELSKAVLLVFRIIND